MIKIAYVIDTIESPTAGTEKQLLMLIKHLDRSKFEPTLFVLRSSDWLRIEFDLCPLVVIEFQSFVSLLSYLRLSCFIKTLKARRFNCIQTHFIDSNIIGVIAGRLAGVPFIISSRRDQGYWHTPAKIILYKLLNQWVNVFVANCLATATWASEKEDIPTERIKTIYNGVDLDLFQPVSPVIKEEKRKKLMLKPNTFTVGIVANLKAVKRIDIFLRAAALVNLKLTNVQFIIAGDGELRKELEIMASEIGILEKVFFLGKREDIPEILAVCDLAVLSSNSESFSNSIVEYLASGLPVITTDVGGCREIIENGVNGFIVPVSDPETIAERIIELMQNKHVNISSYKNRAKAELLFSRKSMVDSFERLYLEGVN